MNCLKPGHTPSTCRSTYKCKFCSQAHNSLLHDNQANSSNPAVLSTNVTNTGVKSCIQDTLLTTAEVLLTGTNGVTLVARALLDSGSTLSIISTKTRKTLALKSLGSSVCIDGVGGAGSSTPCPMVNLHLSSSYRPDWHTDINAAVMCKVTRDIPLQGASAVRELPHIHPLHLADKHFEQARCNRPAAWTGCLERPLSCREDHRSSKHTNCIAHSVWMDHWRSLQLAATITSHYSNSSPCVIHQSQSNW